MGTLLRRSGVALAATVTAVAATALVAGPAAAVADEVTGTVEAGLGLNVRSGSPTGEVVDTTPYGSVVRTYCWTTGPTISATWGGHTWTTNVWDAIDGYTTHPGSRTRSWATAGCSPATRGSTRGGDTSKLVRHC